MNKSFDDKLSKLESRLDSRYSQISQIRNSKPANLWNKYALCLIRYLLLFVNWNWFNKLKFYIDYYFLFVVSLFTIQISPVFIFSKNNTEHLVCCNMVLTSTTYIVYTLCKCAWKSTDSNQMVQVWYAQI